MRIEQRLTALEDARPTGLSAEALIKTLLDETIGFENSEAILRRSSDFELNRAIERVKVMIEEETS